MFFLFWLNWSSLSKVKHSVSIIYLYLFRAIAIAIAMSTLRQFTCQDLFRFNGITLDPLTEMYGISFYLQYMAKWPEYFKVAESPSGDLMGYIMGKSEGQNENWHGHVTAVSISPEHRRLGICWGWGDRACILGWVVCIKNN